MLEHYCKVIMMGRATADPVWRGRLVTFGFVVNTRVPAGDGWRDDPMFIDCEAGHRELAEAVARAVRKGYLLMVEGALKMETWKDAETGKPRRAHKLALSACRVMQKPKAAGSTAVQAEAQAAGVNADPADEDGEPVPS